ACLDSNLLRALPRRTEVAFRGALFCRLTGLVDLVRSVEQVSHRLLEFPCLARDSAGLRFARLSRLGFAHHENRSSLIVLVWWHESANSYRGSLAVDELVSPATGLGTVGHPPC